MKNNNAFTIIGLLSIFILWFISSILINNSLVLPTMNQVFNELIKILSNGSSYLLILNTFMRLLLTILISLIISFTLAIISFVSIKFENLIKPMMVIMKTIPVIAIIILLLIIFGNNKSPYIMTILVILPIIYEGLLTSLKRIDTDILDDLKTISKMNYLIIRSIYFPLIFPYFMTTILQSFGLGLKVMVMAEFIAQPNNSIGYIMQLERSNLNTSAILAWTIILILIVLGFELIINRLRKIYKF